MPLCPLSLRGCAVLGVRLGPLHRLVLTKEVLHQIDLSAFLSPEQAATRLR